ncbi:MAG: RNA polymerase sigma-70 factor (ECF subfamily) [Planctomycetota bacterium]|jgi:RNA polymerase sigma-70 factor (ECF subfamily)
MDRLVRNLLDRLSSSPKPDGESLGAGEVAALVERAKAGDREAFGLLARCHYRRVYVTALNLVGNHEDAEDLAQDTFVRAHRALGWFRGDGAFAAWLRRILVHLANDRFRKESRQPESTSLDSLPDQQARRGTVGEVGARELEGLVERAIQTLPARLRMPLVLRTLDGLDYGEIAESTGVTPATARTQVMQARRALAGLLANYLKPEGESENFGEEPQR